jgi:hypothetical protein
VGVIRSSGDESGGAPLKSSDVSRVDILCSECVRLLEAWNEASHQLCQRSTVLAACAASGDLLRYARQILHVEEAQLRVENAHTAVQLHRATHRKNVSACDQS